MTRPLKATLLALLFATAAEGGSLIAQFVLQFEPCPLCILQRLMFLMTAVSILAGLLIPAGRLLFSLLALLIALGNAAIAAYQGWFASAEALSQCGEPGVLETVLWWLAERVNYPFFAPEASCADSAQYLFLAIPLPAWSLAISVLIALSLLAGLRRT